ncbi:hypothetical protein EDD85DRAFT_932801 [Armillaria nabsnona]|nr:hypothetical protein EDD85DRAFT_932801 [Armillaria nabsnona]
MPQIGFAKVQVTQYSSTINRFRTFLCTAFLRTGKVPARYRKTRDAMRNRSYRAYNCCLLGDGRRCSRALNPSELSSHGVIRYTQTDLESLTDANVPLTAKAISYINFQWEVHQAILDSAKGLRSLEEPLLIRLRLRVRLEKHPDANKRMLFEHNETRRRCRKLTDIESKALHATIMLPVEDRKNLEKQTMIMVVEDDAPLA